MAETALPAWAREDAFPEKPDLAPYGCWDEKGNLTPFEDFDGLKKYLAAGKGKLAWVWLPEHPRLIAPEEHPPLASAIKMRRRLFAEDDFSDAKRGGLIFGGLLIWSIYAALKNGGLTGLGQSQSLGIALLLLLFFAARPLWEGWKGRKELAVFSKESLREEIPEARFELWLGSQKSPFTQTLLALLIAAGAVQFFTSGNGIQEAGLIKPLYHLGERWRIFTAVFLHGNALHFFMNVSALWYLARRAEVLARWPHLLTVFFVGILGSGWATVSLLPTHTSVGVSGAVCSLLGFLLVFEVLHRPLVPRPARRRMLGILISLIVIGFIGFKFIDNAAHLGGLLAGAAYAALVFPKSASSHRPVILGRDLAIGAVALALIVLSGIGAIVAMMTR